MSTIFDFGLVYCGFWMLVVYGRPLVLWPIFKRSGSYIDANWDCLATDGMENGLEQVRSSNNGRLIMMTENQKSCGLNALNPIRSASGYVSTDPFQQLHWHPHCSDECIWSSLKPTCKQPVVPYGSLIILENHDAEQSLFLCLNILLCRGECYMNNQMYNVKYIDAIISSWKIMLNTDGNPQLRTHSSRRKAVVYVLTVNTKNSKPQVRRSRRTSEHLQQLTARSTEPLPASS